MSIAPICASPERSFLIRVNKRFIVHPSLLQSEPPPFCKFPQTAVLNTVANIHLQAKHALIVPASVRCGGECIFSVNGRNTGLGGGGGGGSGGFDGVGEGEEEEEEGFDGNKVVPMLGSPEVGRWLDALLKQLAEYELFVKWMVFRRLLQFGGLLELDIEKWLVFWLMFQNGGFKLELLLTQLLITKVMAIVAVMRLSCYLPAPTTVSVRPPLGVNAGSIAEILYACPDNAFQVMGIVADIMLSYIPALTSVSLCPPIGVNAGSIAQILYACLHKAFQADVDGDGPLKFLFASFYVRKLADDVLLHKASPFFGLNKSGYRGLEDVINAIMHNVHTYKAKAIVANLSPAVGVNAGSITEVLSARPDEEFQVAARPRTSYSFLQRIGVAGRNAAKWCGRQVHKCLQPSAREDN